MTQSRKVIVFLCKALFLCIALTVMAPGTADAKLPKKSECSGKNQPPCPVFYKGPICDEGLGKIGGLCKPCGRDGQVACPASAKGKPCFTGIKIDGRCYANCGEANEKACPKIKSGYPCRGKYEPDNRGFCKPCGGDGEKACRALKTGKQCESGLTKIDGSCYKCGGRDERACPVLKAGKQCDGDLKKIDGICRSCGGPNERACPKLASGFPCRGSYEPDSQGFCRPCGGTGQPACRAFKAGKQCQDGLRKIDGICGTCGGPNEQACPKVFAGYPCRGNYEPDSRGICKPCGGEGQTACRTLKAGARCEDGTHKIDGICQQCGGPDQIACPKIFAGYPCRGEFEPNDAGICKPCGKLGQTACRVLKAGRQCEEGSTERGGTCVSCGGEGQRACKITDRGKPCEEGLQRGLNGICKITPAGATKKAALEELKVVGGDIAPALRMAVNFNGNSGLQSRLSSEDADPAEELPTKDLDDQCTGKYNAISVGIGGEVGAFINVEGEAGWVWGCSLNADAQAGDEDVTGLKMYTSRSLNFRAGGGASAAFTIGFWRDPANRLRGKSHGYALDLKDAFTFAKALKTREFSVLMESLEAAQWDATLGMWFERRDEDGDGDDDEVGRFLGFTVSVGQAMGLDVGGVYIKATTTQVCDKDMKCTEGTWEGEVAGGNGTIYIENEQELSLMASINDGPLEEFTRRKKSRRDFFNDDGDRLRFRKNYLQLRYRSEGGDETRLAPVVPPSVAGAWVGSMDNGNPVGLIIESRSEELLQVSINNSAPKTFTRGRFFRRSYKSADDETIKFRRNFRLVKFEAADGEGGELEPGNSDDVPSTPVGSGDISVLGRWEFTVNGQVLADEFTFQDDAGLVVRRVGTDLDREYNKTGANEYSTQHGGTFRFVTETRALWISPDRQTVFQYNKKE